MILRNLDLRDKRQSKEFEAKLGKMLDICAQIAKGLLKLSEITETDEVLKNCSDIKEAVDYFWTAHSDMSYSLILQKHRLHGNPKALTKDIIEYAELGA